MEVRYQRELNENYLILEDTCAGDAYTVRMLEENEIPGFLKMKRKQMNRTWSFYYEISGRQSVQRILERRPISAEELHRLFSGIDAALQTLEKYLLPADGVRLEPEFIYVKPDFRDPLLCYYPADTESFFAGARRLTQYFLNKIDHADAESVEIVYEMFRISGEDDFGFQDLMQVFHKGEEDAESAIYRKEDAGNVRQEEPGAQLPHKKENGEDRPPGWNRQKDRWSRMEKREAEIEPWSVSKDGEDGDESPLPEYLTERQAQPFHAILLPAGGLLVLGALYFTGCLNRFSAAVQLLILAGGAAALIAVGFLLYRRQRKPDPVWESIREEAFSPGGPETELLGGKRPGTPMKAILISQNLLHHENLEIDTFPWILGKVPGECTCLLDSQVISRIHARIEAGEGSLILYDLGSTNGTFVNQKRLKEGEACVLQDGDQVAFADFAYLLQI